MEIKRSDVNSLESKLASFAEGLPEQEKNVLGWILTRAKNASEVEVTDEDLDGVAGGLADAAGFDSSAREAEADSVSVSVSWSR